MKIQKFGTIKVDIDGNLVFSDFIWCPEEPADLFTNPNDPNMVLTTLANFFLRMATASAPPVTDLNVERIVANAIRKAAEAGNGN